MCYLFVRCLSRNSGWLSLGFMHVCRNWMISVACGCVGIRLMKLSQHQSLDISIRPAIVRCGVSLNIRLAMSSCDCQFIVAPQMSAPQRSALWRLAPQRLAPRRSALRRSALRRSAILIGCLFVQGRNVMFICLCVSCVVRYWSRNGWWLSY